MHNFKAVAVSIKHRGGARAIRQFDIDFSGDCLGIVGLSNDGKTTLINALSGLVSYEGDFLLDDIYLPRKPNGDKVQAILEDYCVLKHKTVRENIYYPLKIRKIKNDLSVDGLIKEFGLEKYSNRNIDSVAKNILPYIAVCRLFLVKRDLYLFDDILKPLKDDDKKTFIIKLKEIFSKLDGLKIYATSNIDEAKELCDKIVILYGGVIQTYGTYQDIVNNPISVRVCEIISDKPIKTFIGKLNYKDNVLSVENKETNIILKDISPDNLISKGYIGQDVQVCSYEIKGQSKFIVVDTETDKSIID